MSVNTSTDCKRFLGISKRIPKDVKRHCGICRQHGIVVETKGHNCHLRECNCEKCELVRQRRCIMSTQIRIRREQDKRFQRTNQLDEADILLTNKDKSEINTCYVCQKCKNHGILKWKKDHKKECEFSNCRCDQCDLIDTRRALDRTMKGARVQRKRENIERHEDQTTRERMIREREEKRRAFSPLSSTSIFTSPTFPQMSPSSSLSALSPFSSLSSTLSSSFPSLGISSLTPFSGIYPTPQQMAHLLGIVPIENLPSSVDWGSISSLTTPIFQLFPSENEKKKGIKERNSFSIQSILDIDTKLTNNNNKITN